MSTSAAATTGAAIRAVVGMALRRPSLADARPVATAHETGVVNPFPRARLTRTVIAQLTAYTPSATRPDPYRIASAAASDAPPAPTRQPICTAVRRQVPPGSAVLIASCPGRARMVSSSEL